MFWLGRYTILSGTLVLPVLITAGRSITWLNVAGIFVSVLVALATAMDALLRSNRRWRLYRQNADRMSSEGAAFFQALGEYACASPTERLHLFKHRIEGSIEDFHRSYVADIETVASQGTPGDGAAPHR